MESTEDMQKAQQVDENEPSSTPSSKQETKEVTKELRQLRNIRETTLVYRRETEEGREAINEYTLQEELGEGSYGVVRRATVQLLGKQHSFAIKIIDKRRLKRKRSFNRNDKGQVEVKDQLQLILQEIAIMKTLKHPAIIGLHQVIDDVDDDLLYIVLDYAEQGEALLWHEDQQLFYRNPKLYQQQQQQQQQKQQQQEQQQQQQQQQEEEQVLDRTPFKEEELRDIIRSLMKGLYYIHLHGIIHRDIKPQNVLFGRDSKPRLSDFGVSSIIQTEIDCMQDTQGTDYFMSPESYVKGHQGKGADVWALGATFYVFAFMELPFRQPEEDTNDYLHYIQNHTLTFPEHRYSKSLVNFLRLFMIKDPSKRPSLFELSQHKWVDVGQSIKLLDEFQNIKKKRLIENTIKEEDIQNAVLPINRVLFMKQVAKKLIKNIDKKK